MGVLRWALLFVVVVACKEAPRGPKLVTRIPHAAGDAVAAEAPDTLPPALIVFVDANGGLAVTAGPARWSALTAYQPPLKLNVVNADVLEHLITEADAFRKRARDDLGSLDGRMRESVSAKATPASQEDDPPPPEEPDDEMSLDEMAPSTEPPPPPRQPLPKTTRGRHSLVPNGGFGYGRSGPGPAGSPAGGSGSFGFAKPIPKAERRSNVIGEPMPTVLPTQAIVAAAPTAKATALVDAVAASEGAILVEHAGAVRVLRVQFVRDREREDEDYKRREAPLIEARVTAQGIELEGVPSPPTKLPLDLTALTKAVAVLAQRERFRTSPVDVLVGTDVPAQQLVDIVAALARSGVTSIGIGKISSIDADEAKHRGEWKRRFKVATAGITIENEKALDDDTRIDIADEIRAGIKAAEPALRTCYDEALATNPDLDGVGNVTFSTDPKGRVTKATPTDLDPLVAGCFVATFQKIGFAKRASKGLVETNVQITMRANP